MQLQLHCAAYPDLKPALLSRCRFPPYCPHPPPPRPHPCTPPDPLLPQYSVLSNHFRRIPLRDCNTIWVAFILFMAFTGTIANPEGFRQETTLKVWQTFRFSAGFRCVFPFAQIHFHGFLQMRPQQHTQGSAASTVVRSSGLWVNLKFWAASEAQALASGADLANVEAVARLLRYGFNSTCKLNLASWCDGITGYCRAISVTTMFMKI